MLADIDAAATVAVSDHAAARAFYEGKLGLERTGGMEDAGVDVYRSGETSIIVYESEFAGTNKATVVTWGVGEEFDRIIADLGAAGVAFEHYDMPGLERAGNVHVADGFKAGWLRDPDGNILHINNQ